MQPLTRLEIRLVSKSALLLAAALFGASMLSAGDGDLDPSWGRGGISAGFANSIPRAAGVAPDQQLYFTGSMTLPDDSEFDWWRTDNEGDGQWYGCTWGLPLLDDFDIREVLFDSSGRLLFVGTTTVFGTETVERAFVARFQSFDGGESCALDTAFSGAGWEYFDDAPYCDTEGCRLIDIEETADTTTRYIALLESVQNALLSNYYLVGLTASGALDPNFNGGSFLPVTATDGAALHGDAAHLAVDRGNRPYVLYSFYDPNGNFDLDVALNRYLQTGDSLDGTFAIGGRMLIDAADAENTFAQALAIGGDGRLGYGLWCEDNFSKVRVFNATMAVSGGEFLDQRKVGALAFDGLGRLLVASDRTSGDGLEIGRWIPQFAPVSLEPDDDFGVGGLRFVDIDGGGGNTEAPVDIEMPGGQPMILVEADQSASMKQAFLVRLENALVFADGFEWGSTKFW
jgi:hypothetical protein